MPNSPLLQLLWLLVLAGCFFSLWKGGPAERQGAAFVLGNLLVAALADTFLPKDAAPVAGLVIDGLTALGLLVIVLIHGSLWLGGAMLLYAVQFSLRAYYFVAERPHDNIHAYINNADFLGIILFMVIGTATAWRRRTATAGS
jgi:hypothetical protein